MSDSQTSVPYGFCQCGCGQKTSIAETDRAEYGWVKGEPRRFRVGHVGAKSIREKLDARTGDRDPNGCLPWVGWFGKNSPYGLMTHRGACMTAHRWAYADTFGPIPDGFHVHHRCENPKCVNPEHLEALDPKSHVEIHRSDTCGRGHEYTPENTYWYRGKTRRCRKCANRTQRAWQKAYGKNASKPREPKPCEVCGEPFLPRLPQYRYCKPECSKIGYRRSKRERRLAA